MRQIMFNVNRLFAVRQMIEDLPECIPVPPELHHRPTEVIFIALDAAPGISAGKEAEDAQGDAVALKRSAAAIAGFRGKGKGGAVARLLQDRQSELEQGA
jgi:hypothetical protein